MVPLHVSTYDAVGGAAMAAYRLHRGLKQLGVDSHMVVKKKHVSDDTVHSVATEYLDSLEEGVCAGMKTIQEWYVDRQRTSISNTMFSISYPGLDLTQLPLMSKIDVINLYWITGFQSVMSIHRLLNMGKPVIWTFHDMWPITGGCHYPSGCNGYMDSCSSCHQLLNDPLKLTELMLADKKFLFTSRNFVAVAPSRWMARRIKESAVFRQCRVEVISNSVQTDVFEPGSKTEAKKAIGIDPDKKTILFGCQDLNEKRKGFQELVEAFKYCLAELDSKKSVNKGRLHLIALGTSDRALTSLGIPVYSPGYVTGETEIATIYNSADIVVLPSLEDNAPNIILEAMSCGIPVVAFQAGGVSEFVEDGITGLVVPKANSKELSQAILSLLDDQNSRQRMGIKARSESVSRFSPKRQAEEYVNLYHDMLGSGVSSQRDNMKEPADRKHNLNIGKLRSDSHNSWPTPIDLNIGPNFNKAYTSILLKALSQALPILKEMLKKSEEDRAARLDVIKDLQDHLRASEEDRAARLDVLNDLQEHLRASEEDRAARLELINDLQAQLKACQEDHKRMRNTIDHLTRDLYGCRF